MPTEKQRINVTVDDGLYKRIMAYCAQKNCSASKAMTDLVQLGLGHYSDDDKTEAYEDVGRFDIKPEHIRMAKAISELPPYSRKVVRTVLKLEENRPSDEIRHLQTTETTQTARNELGDIHEIPTVHPDLVQGE